MTVKEYNNSVDLYSDGVYRFILKNIKDEDKAKDIVQDAFERLWRNFDSVDFKKVKSYVFSTAYHVMIDIIRREKRKEDFNEKEANKIYHNNSYTDLSEILNNAINKLPEDQKSVILLRDYEGYSYSEISEITGLTESQVKVYIFRGRKFLKEFIGSMDVLI